MGLYKKGLVSIVMPTYKRSDTLCRAIDSILNQTYKDIELLLVNDNNPYDEYTISLKRQIKKYESDGRFHFIMQQQHVNGAVARNVGIKLAKGEYIAFLDDDDWWEPNKIELQVEKLASLSTDWGGVSCRIKRYNNDVLIARLPKFKSGDVCLDILMLISDFATGTLLLRREALDQTGYFDESLLRHQDLQILIRFTHSYKLYQVDEYLHCCDVSDTQNRPNVEKILNAKKNLFISVADIVSRYSSSTRRAIAASNKAEIGYVMLKNRMYLRAIGCFLPLLTSPKAFCAVVQKVKNKINSKKL